MSKRKALFAALAVGAMVFASTGDAQAQTCAMPSTGPDVIVGDLTGPDNYTSAGGIEAFSLGTTSCNLGNFWLNWFENTNQHPVIGGTFYRYKDMGGWFAFEQMGQSWLKHGFFALSGGLCCPGGCSPTDGTHLGVGCSDPYSASRNGSQGGLGPKWQVNANKGIFTYPPANPSWSGSVARRLQVATANLEPTASTTTLYFGESHYVTPDDAAANNQNNNASYRRMSVSGSGTAWTFGFIGTTQRMQSAIRAWQDTDPTVTETEITVPLEGGRLILGHKVTDLGGGTWHYEYALYNMNSHESIRAFSLPIPAGVNVTNIGFHDVAYTNGDGEANVNRDGTDWPGTLAGGSLTWETSTIAANPNANALRWGTTYNFRFDADAPPAATDLALTKYRSVSTFTVPGVQAPAGAAIGTSFCDGSDGALAFCPCSPGNPNSGCDIAQVTGGVHMFVSAFAPDGLGGGTATFEGDSFPPVGSPAVVLIRSPGHEPTPVVFGDGVRCVAAAGLVRIQAGLVASGTISLGVSHGAGAGSFAYQMWFRNLPAGFCTADAFNLSNGIDLVW